MADTKLHKSLRELLAEQLPKDISFSFYHYSTPPSKSPALYSAPPHLKPERTYCESHFLAASIHPKDGETGGLPEELLVLAIEVLVYTTKKLTTIFVSKADSTGHLSILNLPRAQGGSPLKTITGTFVSWLVQERKREGKKLVVSLFARAQDQYLFPASIDNKNKHVLDDRGLVKWWCKVLNPLMKDFAVEEEQRPFTNVLVDAGTSKSEKTTAKGYLVIPGFDIHETARYFPSPQQNGSRRWVSAHPLLQIASQPAAPPRCLIPHFPDDPKSRFLDELDEELPDRQHDNMTQPGGTPSRSNGQWKSVKTLDQFWDMMAYRQECSSGRIVGFIWVVITPPQPSIPEEDEEESQQSNGFTQTSESLVSSSTSSPRKRANSRRKPINTRSGPIPLRLPRIKSRSSNASSNSVGSAPSNLPPESSPYFIWPASSRGSLILSTKVYTRASEILLKQNFATRSSAIRSTKRWKDEIAVLGATGDWGWCIIGRKEVGAHGMNGTSEAPAVTLVGVRKKRKVDTEGETPEDDRKEDNARVLGEELVKKKLKVEDTTVPNGVNTLSAGLVRKKPKA